MKYKQKKKFLQQTIISNVLTNSPFFIFFQIQNINSILLRRLQKYLVQYNIKIKFCQNNLLCREKSLFINNIYSGQMLLLYLNEKSSDKIDYYTVVNNLIIELKKYPFIIPLYVFFEKRFLSMKKFEALTTQSYLTKPTQLISTLSTYIIFVRLLQKIKSE